MQKEKIKPKIEFAETSLDNFNKQTNLERFRLHNRRFLGNKYKLLDFINKVIEKKNIVFNSFCDLFAGTGVVGYHFNDKDTKVISNDTLYSSYIALKAFMGTKTAAVKKISKKISYLNNLNTQDQNYFSNHFGGRYFTQQNAKKIGKIREKIDEISVNKTEKHILITSLIYAMDKVANTVGHYDAYREKLDKTKSLKLRMPDIDFENNKNNEIYKEDANELSRKIKCDLVYLDPPYNSRQYCDTYHLPENLAHWQKPKVFGKAKKMDRSDMKSGYCRKEAPELFQDLVENLQCNHILLSYNNTGESKDGRSNAKISDEEIMEILNQKGKVEVFKKGYKEFTTGKSSGGENVERVFYCKVSK